MVRPPCLVLHRLELRYVSHGTSSHSTPFFRTDFFVSGQLCLHRRLWHRNASESYCCRSILRRKGLLHIWVEHHGWPSCHHICRRCSNDTSIKWKPPNLRYPKGNSQAIAMANSNKRKIKKIVDIVPHHIITIAF